MFDEQLNSVLLSFIPTNAVEFLLQVAGLLVLIYS